ncbi:MAG: hypothetical protein JRH06_13580 [Deltaproteobacteria bacterium]|nr:hypothetical protein [Deltaproteobacteria bacterium]MBW2138573.1 hypothetical protein [Deltaproteobacteria bacterium]
MALELTINDLREFAGRYVEEESGHASARWWRPPLLVSARAGDRFDDLRQIADQDHLLPGEVRLPDAL